MNNLTYKYQTQIELIAEKFNINCPCKEAENVNKEAFRWVHKEITHEFNFLPNVLIAQKQGRSPRRFPPDKIHNNCNQYALSMYDTEQQGIDYFYGLRRKIREKLGYTHIAKGVVEKQDGVANPSDNAGHFGFHEYRDVTLVDKFQIVNTL